MSTDDVVRAAGEAAAWMGAGWAAPKTPGGYTPPPPPPAQTAAMIKQVAAARSAAVQRAAAAQLAAAQLAANPKLVEAVWKTFGRDRIRDKEEVLLIATGPTLVSGDVVRFSVSYAPKSNPAAKQVLSTGREGSITSGGAQYLYQVKVRALVPSAGDGTLVFEATYGQEKKTSPPLEYICFKLTRCGMEPQAYDVVREGKTYRLHASGALLASDKVVFQVLLKRNPSAPEGKYAEIPGQYNSANGSFECNWFCHIDNLNPAERNASVSFRVICDDEDCPGPGPFWYMPFGA